MLNNVNLPLLELSLILLRLELDHDEVLLRLDPKIEAYLDQVVSQLYLESWESFVVAECHLPLEIGDLAPFLVYSA
jgi:hypothetical protein